MALPASKPYRHPLVFDEFFDLGLPDSASPFLTPSSRKWGVNLPLKSSFLAAFLLIISFILSFDIQTLPLSYLSLLGVYFFVGIPALIESIENIIDLEINIDVLMTLAAFGAIFIGSGMEGGLLLVLFAISGSMEETVTAKAKGAIRSLHKLSPTKACVIDPDGTILERSVKDIGVGSKILVKSGEIVPLDGIVTSGFSTINVAHLTGENLPVSKKPGDEVPSGSFNQEGALVMEVSRTSSDSTLSRIIQLVTQAQEARPRLQRWFDTLSTRYATSIILFSLFFALFYPFISPLTPHLGREGSIYRALAFLIAASPCALIIAIPIAYLSGISVCAKKGIMLKGGIVLDSLAGCKAIAFDKTGTLTLGQLTCTGIDSLDLQTDISDALAIANALEKNAVHPIAKAICLYADQQNAKKVVLEEYKSLPGYGLQGKVKLNGKIESVEIGNPDYIMSLIDISKQEILTKKIEEIRETGELVTVLMLRDQLYIFRFLDMPRPNIRNAISTLKEQNLDIVMLTGDHENSAKRVAADLGIDHYFSNLKPEDKLKHVDALSQEKGLVMIGDGINDAPALARASVGIAMGKVGSATAVEASDVVFLNDNLELLPWLIDKARTTKQIVRQNLFIAVGAIFIATVPALSGYIPLWLAVVLHEGGTVLVGLNALRILK